MLRVARSASTNLMISLYSSCFRADGSFADGFTDIPSRKELYLFNRGCRSSVKHEENQSIAFLPCSVYNVQEPISKIPSSRVARDFFVSARRDEKAVAIATATKLQRSGTRKSPQPFGIRPILCDRGVASGSEYLKIHLRLCSLRRPKIGQYRGRRYF